VVSECIFTILSLYLARLQLFVNVPEVKTHVNVAFP
jgi:hypothetical protein